MGLAESKSENIEESIRHKYTSVSLFDVPNHYIKEMNEGGNLDKDSKQPESKSISIFCDLCFHDGIFHQAFKFCDTCNGYLCHICFEQHGYPNCKTCPQHGSVRDVKRGEFVKEKKRVTFDPLVLSEKTPEKDEPIKVNLEMSGNLEKVITFSVTVKEDKKEPWITGIVASSDTQLVLVDGRNFRVKIVDTLTQQVTSNVELESDPFDICIVSKHEVAITLPEIQRIQMMTTLNGLALTRRMKVKGHCFGIAHRTGLLGISYLCPEKIEIVTLNGQVIHRIRPNKGETDILNMPYYLTFSLSGKSVYVSDHRNSTITRLSHSGHIMSTYTDGDLLHPESVHVLGDGSLLVVSRDSNCIHHITENCEKKNIILTRRNKLKLPWTLCYERTKATLYVSNREGQEVSCYNFPLEYKTVDQTVNTH